MSKMCHSLSDKSTRAVSVLGAWCNLLSAVPCDDVLVVFKNKGKWPKNNNVSVVSSEVADVIITQ